MIIHAPNTVVSPMALMRHRPKVEKLSKFWWSKCSTCGHVNHYISWRRAYIDALIHSEEIR